MLMLTRIMSTNRDLAIGPVNIGFRQNPLSVFIQLLTFNFVLYYDANVYK